MREDAPAGSGNALALTCWLPAACLVAIEIYVRNFDGWGAWATAPLFLLPLLLSLAIAGAGAVQSLLELRAGLLRPRTAAFTGVAALPIVWLLVRRYFAAF